MLTSANVSSGAVDRIVNNTVYQPVGDGVQLVTSAGPIDLRNNIIQVNAGHAISVDLGSEAGLTSDYNLLFTTGTGRIGSWAGVELPTLTNWFSQVNLDSHSLNADPLFINPAGEDGILGFVGVDGGADDNFHVQGISLAVDGGDPNSYYLGESSPNGGRVNLGFDGNTPFAAASPTQVVQVLSPNGRDKFQAGQVINVQWRSYGLGASLPVALIDAGGPAADIWSAGAVVHVDTGNYLILRNIVLDPSENGLTLQGASAVNPSAAAVMDGGRPSTSNSGGYAVFELQQSSGATIDHLSITGGTYGVWGNGAFQNGHETISNNLIFANVAAGVFLDANQFVYDDTASILNNTVNGLLGVNQYASFRRRGHPARRGGNRVPRRRQPYLLAAEPVPRNHPVRGAGEHRRCGRGDGRGEHDGQHPGSHLPRGSLHTQRQRV